MLGQVFSQKFGEAVGPHCIVYGREVWNTAIMFTFIRFSVARFISPNLKKIKQDLKWQNIGSENNQIYLYEWKDSSEWIQFIKFEHQN